MKTIFIPKDFTRIAPLVEKKCMEVLQQFLPNGGVLPIKAFYLKSEIRSSYSLSACILNTGSKEATHFFISANRNEVDDFLSDQYHVNDDVDLSLDFLGELANVLNGKILEQGFFMKMFGEQNPSPPLFIASSFYQKGIWSIQGEFYASNMKLLIGFGTAHNQIVEAGYSTNKSQYANLAG